MSRISIKKQTKNLKAVCCAPDFCYPLGPVVEGLYHQAFSYQMLPTKMAFIRLGKLFLYGPPAVKKIAYYLAKTGHYDDLIRKKRMNENNFNPSLEQVMSLIEFATFLVRRGGYRNADLIDFDFNKHCAKPIHLFTRLLAEVFGIKDIPPFLANRILDTSGLKMLLQWIQCRRIEGMSKKETKWLLKAPPYFTMTQAKYYAVLKTHDASKEMATRLARLFALNQQVMDALLEQNQWGTLLRFFSQCQESGTPIDAWKLYYFASLLPYSDQWVRQPEDFVFDPNRGGKVGFYHQILEHLLTTYPVPKFLYPSPPSFYHYNRSKRTDLQFIIYLHLAQGGNLRKLPGFPYQLTSKEAHYFLEAPLDSGLARAYRFGQLRALGANKILATELSLIFAQMTIVDEPYLKLVMQFLVRHFPDGYWDLHRLILFIGLQYRSKEGFSLKGRTKDSFLRCFNQFKKEVADYIDANPGQQYNFQGRRGDIFTEFKDIVQVYVEQTPWKRLSINDFCLPEKAGADTITYRIEQLNSAIAIRQEGKQMKHCAATYVMRCFQKSCSLWSMTCQREDEPRKRMVTIEVRNKRVVQVKGLSNRQPNNVEAQILKLWKEKERLF